MANTPLNLEVVKGETMIISMELSDADVPVDLTDYTVYFAITEQAGMTPVIAGKDTDVDQEYIVVVPGLGQIEITIPSEETRFEFIKGAYAVFLFSDDETVTYLLLGDLDVITPADVVPLEDFS